MSTRTLSGGLLLLFTSLTFAAGESQQDSQILSELQALTAQVSRLEDKVDRLETMLLAVTGGGGGTAVAEGERETLVGQVMSALQKETEAVNFPWMDGSKWALLEKGMSPEAVRAILGEPTLEDPSLHRRIDIVYTYRGRRPVDGQRLVGKVKFYHDALVAIEAP